MAKNLLAAVRRLEKAFSGSDVVGMRILGNGLIEEAALGNDRKMAELALIGYSLHKLSTKEHIVSHDKWLRVKRRVLASLEKAGKALEKNDSRLFEKTISGIVEEIREIDAKLGNFAQGLFEKARVKYAANAYSLGLSLSQATALTGARKKDVLEYVGATRISDRDKVSFGIRERLEKLAESM